MNDSEKMNALDFIINVLREHEKKLDSLASKFEGILSGLSALLERRVEEHETNVVRAQVSVICDNWSDFKSACSGAEIVAFNQDSHTLCIKAMNENIVYEYREMLPTYVGSLRCGIPLKCQISLDASEVKRILSRELNVPENRIIEGEIRLLK